MDWTFNVRGNPFTVTSIETLRAVFPTSEFSATATLAEYRSNFGEVSLEEHPSITGMSSRDRRIFERAGWWFVAPKTEVAAATAVNEAVPNAKAVSEVYMTGSGAVF